MIEHKPVTRIGDLLRMKLKEKIVTFYARRGEIDQSEYEKRLQRIKTAFEQTVSTSDRYELDTIEELKQSLQSLGYSNRQIDEIADHEQAHFDELTRLGYNPRVEVWLARVDDRRAVPVVSVFAIGQMSEEDHNRVRFAPKDPSYFDQLP